MGAEFSQLKAFRDRLKGIDTDAFCRELTKELGKELYARLIFKTPVGIYGTKTVEFDAHLKQKDVNFTTKTGKKVSFTARARTKHVKFVAHDSRTGGTLRRGWFMGQVKSVGGNYSIDINNNVYYAPYVNYGHRTPNHKGWVKGQFFVEEAEKEIKREQYSIISNSLDEFLRRSINGTK